MKYLVMGAGCKTDKLADAVYGTNDIQEAVKVAEEIGPGTLVVERSIKNDIKIIHTVFHPRNLGLSV